MDGVTGASGGDATSDEMIQPSFSVIAEAPGVSATEHVPGGEILRRMSSALWPFPFQAGIWGTVAAWVVIVLMVGSLILGILTYVHNRRTEQQKAQARHVRFTSLHWTDESYFGKVHNLSEKSIYDVCPNQSRKWPFRRVVAEECLEQGQRLSAEEIADLKARWDATSGGTMYAWDYESAHLAPEESREVAFRGPKSVTEQYWVTFRDSMGRKWALELDGTEPLPAVDEISNEKYPPRRSFRNPVKYFRHRNSMFHESSMKHMQHETDIRNIHNWANRLGDRDRLPKSE
ncbi:hypothetical protein [Nocardia sp. CA-120079]|uniref:hypothetical protein n=1 Tax=Nocardia sp. CA-120079 TaxID=3239974 RepID=UPI003D99DA6F